MTSQIGMSNRGGTRYKSMAFTEQGVAMLSGILNSDRVIEVNIQILRAFVKLRQMVLDHAELKQELAELRSQTDSRFESEFQPVDRQDLPPSIPYLFKASSKVIKVDDCRLRGKGCSLLFLSQPWHSTLTYTLDKSSSFIVPSGIRWLVFVMIFDL